MDCCIDRRRIAVAIALALVACDSAKSTSDSAKTTTSSDRAPAIPANTPETKPDTKTDVDTLSKRSAGSRPMIVESDVRTLIDAWLAAQNRGDFAAYEAMYARRFEGVRRSGPKVVRLDRAGWVKERQRMFKRKMTVEMTDVTVDVFAQSAVVTFKQRWASGNYEDVGPKQIVFAREHGKLRIAREEMLLSTLVGDAKKTALADDGFVFVIDVADTSYAVLAPLGKVGTRSPKLLADGEAVAVGARVDVQKLPVSVSGWQGQVLSSAGCRVKVDEILAISRIVPHFGERQAWSGEMDDAKPYTKAEIARAAFNDDAAYLVGRLSSEGAMCAPGRYAHVVDAQAPAAGMRVTEGVDVVEKSAVSAFRSLPSYQRIQNEFEGESNGNWDEFVAPGVSDSGLDVHVYRYADKGRHHVVVQARAGTGCGMFEGQLTAFFQLDGSLASPTLTPVSDMERYIDIFDALDLDGDGVLEYLGEVFFDTVVIDQRGEEQRRIAIPYYDCDC